MFSQVTDTHCTGHKPDAIDVRLSTAAGVSARSPIVSPHANIRDRNGQVADSWADGGYFDNSGAVTAYEMAVALKRADSRLEPYVVQISSEPQWFIDNCQSRLETRPQIRIQPQQVAKEEAPPLPNEADFSVLGTWGDVSAINSTRVARSYETMVALGNQIEAINNKKASYSLIYVCPQQRENIIYNSVVRLLGDKAAAMTKHKRKAWKNVSLSWWLSPGLQAYLDRQLYAPYNKQELDSIVELLQE